MLATPKHFAAYGAVAAGLDYCAADLAPQTLRDVHLPPFRAAIEAGALSIMTSFNDINGVPATANHELLTGILREEWGFEGLVVSDYTSDLELIEHGFASDEKHAAELSLRAGLDMSMQSGIYLRHLRDSLADGKVTMAMIDQAARRVLLVKARMGLFANPYRSLDPGVPAGGVPMPAHDALARDAARRSIVLLKNEGGLLPLRKTGQRIALVGPFAADHPHLSGCWNIFGDRSREVGLRAGLAAALRESGPPAYAPGCGFEEAIPGGIERAVEAARRADVVVLALGEPANYSGEAQSRTQIVLPAVQEALAAAIIATGVPVVVLVGSGRALALGEALGGARALLATWHLGTQTGPAVADVLFGDYNPSARLPVSFPRNAGQQPYFYNHTATGRPYRKGGAEAFRARWRDTEPSALYPFGHGLSYTTFAYGAIELSTNRLAWDASLRIRARITNTGGREGEEVVQLYLRDCVASRVRPVRELKGFRKIRLAAGGSEVVEFDLARGQLGFHGVDNLPVVEPGMFEVWVAPSAVAGEAAAFELMGPA
jgi:beta-glucosidase